MINTDGIKMVVLDVDGTMTDGRINIMDDGTSFKQFNAKDGLGIRMLVKKGIRVAIISHSFSSKAIEARGKMLGVTHIYAGLEEKDVILEGWCKELGLAMSEVAFMGDDLNDIPAMEKVGLSVCPSDSSPGVLSFVDIVLEKKGGYGCVREFADKYMGVTYSKIK